jgi:flagellar biogenesis protein FliO
MAYAPCAYAQNQNGEKNAQAPSNSVENTVPQIPKSLQTPSLPDTSPFEIPVKQDDRFFYQFLNMLFSLGTILVLIFIISWLLKRFLNTRLQQLNTSSLIKIIERRSLTPKTTLYVLEINGKDIAIAESTNGITLLSHSFEQPLASNPDFEKILNEKKTSSGDLQNS